MFDTKKPYDLGVQPRFRLYDVFTLQKPYESGYSCTSGNAGHEFAKTQRLVASQSQKLNATNFYDQSARVTVVAASKSLV